LPLTDPLDAKTAVGWIKLLVKLWKINTNPWFAFIPDDSVSPPKSYKPEYVSSRVLTFKLSRKKMSSIIIIPCLSFEFKVEIFFFNN